MGVEIERKFLVKDGWWEGLLPTHPVLIRQAYLATGPEGIVRVRTYDWDDYVSGDITIKGPRVGLTCPEYEWEIPKEDAEELMDSPMRKGNIVQKQRHSIHIGMHLWEVDEFEGELFGLTIAEIELESESEEFEKPEWIGEEVSYDKAYTNVVLAGAME